MEIFIAGPASADTRFALSFSKRPTAAMIDHVIRCLQLQRDFISDDRAVAADFGLPTPSPKEAPRDE